MKNDYWNFILFYYLIFLLFIFYSLDCKNENAPKSHMKTTLYKTLRIGLLVDKKKKRTSSSNDEPAWLGIE